MWRSGANLRARAVVAQIPVAAPAAASSDDSEESTEDQVADAVDGKVIGESMQSQTPCSCDCCQVQKMVPSKFVKRANGATVTSQCLKSSGPSDQMALSQDEESHSQDICPTKCQLDKTNGIITTSRGEMDYNRFCHYNCRPLTDAAGTACAPFNKKDYQDAAEQGGNGKEVFPEPVLGEGSGYGSGLTGFEAAGLAGPGTGPGAGAPAAAPGAPAPPPADPIEKAKAAERAKKEGLQVIYDMRKLVAERLRSEAGASVAAGAAAAERVRINQWATKKDAAEVKKLRVKFDAEAAKLETGVSDTNSAKDKAGEEEDKVKVQLAKSRDLAKTIALTTRKLADEAIKKVAGPCSKQAAKDRAEAKGLDKPPDWVKVVAARAANPYQVAVTAAVQRTDEYKRYADGLMDQAFATQSKANAMIPHVNALEAQGDVLGATIEKKQVTDLLSHAKALQSQAQGYMKTAEKTRSTIPKWQMAAAQAAAFSSWDYAQNAKLYR